MSMPSSNWAARTFRGAFQKTVTNVFYSRGVSTRRRRTRRAAQQISIELLEGRRLLAVDPNLGWIKIDLSQLDQTGVGDAYDIYVQGNSAGMFIQQLDNKLMFARPQLGLDQTLPANPTWTFENPDALFVGGNVTFFDGTTSVGTAKIKSIAANVKVAAYNAGNPLVSRWGTTDVFNAFSFSGVTKNAQVAINSGGIGTGTMENTGGIATLKDFNTPAAGSSVFTLGSVVVGNSPDYKFPNNNSTNDKTNGNGPSWTNPTYVTQIDNYSSSALTADASLSSIATGKLLNSSLQVYQNGIGGKYATLPAIPTTSVPVSDAKGKPVGQAVPLTIDNLLSTNQLPKTAFPTYNADGVATISWQVQFQGNAADKPSSTGLLPVYSVDSYTVTFDSPPPANATKVTFHAQIGATIHDPQSFTIDTSSAGFPGLSTSTLFIGMQLVIAPGTSDASTANVKALAAAGSTITVTLAGPLPVQFTSGSAVTIALPPTGGTLTATKVDSSSPAANAIWVKQTNAPVVGEGNFSLNGSRIYFSLVPKGSQPQAMTWFSSGSGIAVNQWTPAQIWSGAVPASVYTELTVDDFSGTGKTGAGDVFFDLSGVDGFFFPAGISYQKDAQTEWVVGQPWKNYSAPNTKGPNTYGPVTRTQIIAAFQGFFGSAGGKFSTDAKAQALATQYQALVTKTKTSDGAVLGIKNPSFAYSSPTSSVPAFDTCWNPALDALFAQGNQIDMIGDDSDPRNSNTLYYKGMSTSVNSSPITGVTATGYGGSVTYTLPQGSGPLIPGQTVTVTKFANAALNGMFTVLSAPSPTATTFTVSNASVTQQTQGTAGTVVPSYRAIQFKEYSGDYNSATGGDFYVFDPRTPPPSETAAFSGGTPMSVGYQVFGNTGVFASTQIVSVAPTPNSVGSVLLVKPDSALAQLAALQRDIVTALNRGIGGFGIGNINSNVPGAGVTTNYWQTQNNWYPYAAPYGAQTPQNIYSQWFHTAVIAQAGQTYTVPATYPLGGGFGDPQKSWGGGVQSGGPYMNMYYGFGYDEKGCAPSNANTNAQFPGINNTAGNTLSFGVVLGPWNASTPTKPGSPTSVVAKSGNASLGVTWAAPTSTGGSAITNYLVKYSSDNGKKWIRWGKTTVITATSCTVTGLTNGLSYVIKVIAQNSVGISLPSDNSATAIPGLPGPPTAVKAIAGNAQVAVTWVTPAYTGGSPISDYEVQYWKDGVRGWKTFVRPASTAISCTVTGLTNGTRYQFKVSAKNAAGNSAWSLNSAPVTPNLSLSATLNPTFGATTSTANGFTVQIANYNAAYTWAGTATASGLVAISSTGLVKVTGVAAATSSTATITTTKAGIGDGSAPVTATSLGAVPGAPKFVKVFSGNNQLLVTWSVPTSTGGSPISDYVVEYWQANVNGWKTFPHPVSTATSCTVTGLTNDTSYVFRVSAKNAAGKSLPSANSTPVLAMSMVMVGNPSNAADTSTGSPYGAVSYAYQIGAYDVRGWQYTAFLNAVGKTDTYALYNPSMATDTKVAQISRSGTSGSYTYTVIGSTGNRPISYVSWFDSARFSNWMSNGQPSGAQTVTTTENGAYNLSGTSGNAVAANVTNPNTSLAPRFKMPLENEWYKAAYYDPTLNSGTGGYYVYATKSNSAPGTTIGSSANQANYNQPLGTATDVGSFSGSGSSYGTFDQSGNVYQWNDLDGAAGSSRGLRGGSWNDDSLHVSSSYRFNFGPSYEESNIGFRLASPVFDPTFGTPTATADGFTVQITNYNPAYSWAGTATASGTVAINSSTGLVTVTGVAAATSSTATITTTKTGYTGGSAKATATSLVAMSMVTVGNPGNAADTGSSYPGYGAVSYSYQIGAYDVTGTQYTAFLNAVGKTDTYGLYNAAMGTDARVAQISRSGSSGSYNYAVIGITGNRPISYVSWFDSARFSNWMSNGQPIGAPSSTTTENGAYTLVNGAITGNAVAANAINPNTSLAPTYRIPLENEWYKAAYYDPTLNSGTGGYYVYATKSDTAPVAATASNNSLNQANYNYNPVIGRATDVGSFSGSGSGYGTFDQSGNVYQLNDLDGTAGSSRGIRGGDWISTSYSVSSSGRVDFDPPFESGNIGFRLASPVTTTLTPTFGTPTATADGFTVQITNYDSSYSWAGTATASGTVVVSGIGLVTVTGVAALTSSTATITTTKSNTVGGSAPVMATSLAAALTPTFGTPTATATGFTVQITNYDSSYTWAGKATASGIVWVSNTGLVIVAGVAAGTSSTATITTKKSNTAGGTADVTATSLMPMSMVTVGNPGNAADTNTGSVYGAVSYSYQIGAYDVTGSQYAAFLNAVGSTDTYALYNANMGTDANVAQISQLGSSGSYTYAVMNSTGSRPISYVSWFDSARFSNWMSNGQPRGAQTSTTTENGTYTLVNGATSGNAVAANATNPNTNLAPTYRIPLENEWYKAAYYDPTLNSGTGGYYVYATKSNSAPGTTIGSTANQANYDNVFGRSTDVGSSFSGSGSFYGTFDQSGNVNQWNDLDGTTGSSRGLRGGSWYGNSNIVSSSYRFYYIPSIEFDFIGFRLASPV